LKFPPFKTKAGSWKEERRLPLPPSRGSFALVGYSLLTDDPPSPRSYGVINLLPRASCVPSVRRSKPLYGRFRFAFENRPARITVPKVEIADVIRGPSTTLPNSVSPGKTKQIAVTITPSSLPAGTFFKFVVDNQGDADAGSATITVPGNGQLTASGNITVKGGTQTKPGHSSKLKIVAQLNGDPAKICGRSKGFSVCAHSHKFSTVKLSDLNYVAIPGQPVDTLWVGLEVKNKWESDSGANALGDLDKVTINEAVGPPNPINTPPFPAAALHIGGPLNAVLGNTIDDHAYQVSPQNVIVATAPGVAVFPQLFMFKCDRCGAVDEVCDDSGFEITHTLTHVKNSWRHHTKKTGLAATVNGKSATAGTGSAPSGQHVILPP